MNFATLESDIADWLARSDLTAVIPSFIRLAEDKFYRKLRLRAQESEVTLTVGATTPERIDFPADFLKVITLMSGLCKLNYVTRYTESNSLSNTQYSTFGFQGLVGPNVDAELDLKYYARLPALTAVPPNDVNWIVQNAYDIYLYGALLEATPYLQDDARLAIWGGLYNEAIQRLIESDKKDKLGEGPLTPTMAQRWTP
jgi:hypothetical protein